MGTSETSRDFYNENPFHLKSADEIYAELAAARACYERGEYEDFDEVMDEISAKYDLSGCHYATCKIST